MLRRLSFVCCVAMAAQVHAAEAGKVIFTAGAASIADGKAAEGAPVLEGQMLSTGADGYLYVKTIDNGLFILRPNTRARIVTYHVDTRNPADTQVKLELLNGVARSKSGDAVKQARQNFRFNTPIAAIGVRGTDFTVYTDQETSRVAVLTGRVVVSGFGGVCTPEGGGPCDGAASRELSAAQRGQLLQVKRGQLAPQLLSGSTNAPDQVSPPRTDEPVAKTSAAPDSAIEAKKSDSVDKAVVQVPQKPATAPPVVDVVVPPVTTPTTPQLPQQEIQWGRWAAVLGQAPSIGIAGPDGAERQVEGPFVMFRTTGQAYATPERGSASFNLKSSEAYIYNDDLSKAAVPAHVNNGVLSFNFDKSTFLTSFNLVGGAETFKMTSSGTVTSDGHFSTDNASLFNLSSNATVNGLLSNQNGGSAAYLFRARLDENRTTNGVTFWSR